MNEKLQHYKVKWLSHLERMEDDIPQRRRNVGRPRMLWRDEQQLQRDGKGQRAHTFKLMMMMIMMMTTTTTTMTMIKIFLRLARCANLKWTKMAQDLMVLAVMVLRALFTRKAVTRIGYNLHGILYFHGDLYAGRAKCVYSCICITYGIVSVYTAATSPQRYLKYI
jgi:hypothetical protein